MPPQQIKLDELNIQELTSLRESFDRELKISQAQFEALSSGKARFESALDSMTKLHDNEGSQEILVPMTQSVYQKGKLLSQNRFTVDIGAGYYLERTYDKQAAYLNKRIAQIDEKLQACIKRLQEQKQAQEIMGAKLQQKIAALQTPPAA